MGKTLLNLIKTKIDVLPPEESFLVDLKATVSADNPPRKRSSHYKPSSLNCMRVMYFDRTQALVDTGYAEYSGIRICETGSNSHENIQRYISHMAKYGKPCEWIDPEKYAKENGLDYLRVTNKKEFETHFIDTRYDLSFLCDGIIRYKGKLYIFEAKTETDDKGLNREEASPEHRYQSYAYSLSLKISDIMWLYEERNFCMPKTFHTTVTDENRLELVRRIEYVDQCVKDMKVPEKCNSRKTCNYCCYKTECKKYPERRTNK